MNLMRLFHRTAFFVQWRCLELRYGKHKAALAMSIVTALADRKGLDGRICSTCDASFLTLRSQCLLTDPVDIRNAQCPGRATIAAFVREHSAR
ncbi:MAG: hypothetical protein OXC08_20720 [Thiotrichales bacterium]|nr:hypothetical protein [Thiotrichales bacterium]